MAMGNGKAEPSMEQAQAMVADLERRVKAFNGELIPLLGKYKVGLGAVPFIAPDGRILARPQLFDDSKAQPKVEGDLVDPKSAEQKVKPTELAEG